MQNDKVYLSIGTRGGLEDTDYLTIDNIYAVSRFFEFKRIDLECVDGKVDISSLPPAEYSIRVDYTLMGKSYSEPLASPKDLTIAIDKNYRGYGVRYDTKWALLKIYKKNRFTLMKDNRQILFRVNDATINQLFFYNIQDNKKIDINLDDNRLFRIDFGSFPKGKNVLVYHSEDGGFNTIKFFECSNSDNQRVLFKQIVERDRIEVNV